MPSPLNITPTAHEKAEWSRLATNAYSNHRNDLGHAFSAAASLPHGAAVSAARFDQLQNIYRTWLVFGLAEVPSGILCSSH